MPGLKNYGLFVSHAWKHNDEYYRLVALLSQAKWFEWRNFSIPEHDPLGTRTDRDLLEALDHRIRLVNVYLLVAGMYVLHRAWIQAEIDIAKSYGKPIIGVRPWGAERVPVEVQLASAEMVSWNTDSIVGAVRRQAL